MGPFNRTLQELLKEIRKRAVIVFVVPPSDIEDPTVPPPVPSVDVDDIFKTSSVTVPIRACREFIKRRGRGD